MSEEIEPKVTYCSICQVPYSGYGHNAQPINNGRCCDACNTVVINARILRILFKREVREVSEV